MKKRILAVIACLMLMCSTAFAGVLQPTDDFYVLDDAGVLDIDTEGMIVFSNDLLFADCGAQIVVVAAKSIDGADIADYAYDMYNEWGIGNAAGEGFLLLMAIEEDDYYLLAGEGIDSELTGGKLVLIRDEYLEPDFAKKNYDAAVDKTFRQLFAAIADICGSDATVEEGIKLYEEYMAGAGAANSVPAANDSNYYADYRVEAPQPERSGVSIWSVMWYVLLALIIIPAVILACAAPVYRRRHPGSVFMPFIPRPRIHIHRGPRPHHPPRPNHGPMHRSGGMGFGGRPAGRPGGSSGGSHSRSTSSFGGGRSGGRSTISRSSGGFGGGRSGGGGRSRGGGVGRGR